MLKNQMFKQCYSLMFLNIFIAVWSISSILYSKFTNANFGTEVSAYLFIVFIMGSINSVYFSKLGSLRYCSDDEWSKKLITILAINLLQYGADLWGCWISYKVFMSRYLAGTKMYYYLFFSKWMYNTLFGMTAFFSLSVIYSSFVYSRLLISLTHQRVL